MRYPISIQNFEKLMAGGYVYVDKTDLIYELSKENVCFLSRPRRFGKSLLLSTLEAYFRGQKELFQGLKIAELEQEWAEYPIFHIDFSNGNFNDKNTEMLDDILQGYVGKWERIYGADPLNKDLGSRCQPSVCPPDRSHQVLPADGVLWL